MDNEPCNCECHRTLSVMHIMACCDFPRLNTMVELADVNGDDCIHESLEGRIKCERCYWRRVLRTIGYFDAKTPGNSYRKKPVKIRAIEYDPPYNCDEVWEFLGWEMGTEPLEDFYHDDEECDEYVPLFIQTLEGLMEASPGDYIIRGVKGEFYPCKPDVFEMTYELES